MTATTHDDELMARVWELRERGSAPKQIAKALGLRWAQATALVRRVAEEALANVAPDERPVVGAGSTRAEDPLPPLRRGH